MEYTPPLTRNGTTFELDPAHLGQRHVVPDGDVPKCPKLSHFFPAHSPQSRIPHQWLALRPRTTCQTGSGPKRNKLERCSRPVTIDHQPVTTNEPERLGLHQVPSARNQAPAPNMRTQPAHLRHWYLDPGHSLVIWPISPRRSVACHFHHLRTCVPPCLRAF